ncbi:Thoeris protein ThsB TIR-like domain-containing protein [uncultured Gammaproteobacteria bacterium]
MAKPNIMISHRWAYQDDYLSLTKKLKEYGLDYLDYSVPEHDPLDAKRVKEIEAALNEQVRQCNYFLVFAQMAMDNSRWCKFEVQTAVSYSKPILSVRPYGYTGNIPVFIQNADNQNGPAGFNTPAIIRKICEKLGHPAPYGL